MIGQELDVDLLAAVLGRGVVELLDDAERAAAQQLLTEEDGAFGFRHELVRQALAATATAGRAALLHRQAGRVLARQPAADPALVAHHARLGGDLELASRALRDASARAAERFDHAAAEALLDDALSLHPDPEGWLARARVRTRRGRYREALADVELAAAAGPAALEVGAWASYFDRHFTQAAQFAADGALAADDAATRARCLAAGGRTHHAAGDLARAELLLGEAFSLAEGADRVTTAAWLGVLRAHQSRVDEALSLLRPAARGQVGVEHTSATLHSLLFTGHAHALAGAPALALATFARYTAEVERRHVPRFAGRAVNFAGWVLRNLGARSEALDHHAEALEVAQRQGTAEVTIAALEDLAEQCLEAGDADGAQARLAQALALLRGDLVFGWRLELKHRLLAGRLALLRGDADQALADAGELEARAAGLGVPRYTSVARLLRHRAARALGRPVDAGAVAADLDLLDASVAIEAWWWTGDVAADFASSAWLDRAADRAGRLATHAGDYADVLRRAADQRLVAWRAAVGLCRARSAGREDHHGDHQRPCARHRPLRRPPQRGPVRVAQRAHERRDVGHAQPPGRQLCRGNKPRRDGGRAQPHLAEARRRRFPGEHLRVTRLRLDVPLEPHVPGRGAVARRAEHLVNRRLGRVGPARRERAGGDGAADPPCLAQARGQAAEMAEGERGHDQVEAAVTERQRGRVGGHRVQRRAAAAQHATARSAATTCRAPAASAARPATPVPAPRSSTRRPATGTAADATSARASCSYTCSGPPAQSSAALS